MVEKDVKVYGGIVLNYFMGGLNVCAVDVALKMGAKFIWFPTISSKQHIDHYRGNEGKLFQGIDELIHPNEGISILDADGNLTEEVHQILDVIKRYDCVVCSGHIHVNEVVKLADAVFEKGITRFLINHPDMGIAPIPLEIQKELARKGAYLEKCYMATTSSFNSLNVEKMAITIKEIGVDQCIIVTDFGQSFNITPIEAMKEFIQELLKNGMTEEDIRAMYVKNPKALIGETE